MVRVSGVTIAKIVVLALFAAGCSESFKDVPAPGGAAGSTNDGGVPDASSKDDAANTGGSSGSAGTGGSAGSQDAGPDAAPCSAGFGDCDGDLSNGCETALTSLMNCGSCAVVCNAPAHVLARCEYGGCTFTCISPYLDCDGNPLNGCEVNTQASPSNCGACHQACGSANATANCTSGVCALACKQGYNDCDGITANGCEVDTQTSPSNCGTCNQLCGWANAVANCAAGVCALACKQGYDDCDKQNATGCESNLQTSTANCGACSVACGSANATPSCNAGLCALACAQGYTDCDGKNPNGCEIDTDASLANCGTCNHACGSANATPNCIAGGCVLACAQGYGDCDGQNVTGCESPLATDAFNCGRCGRNCGKGTCVAGQCTAWTMWTDITAPKDIAVDGTNTYWTLQNAIRRIPKTGGSPGFVANSVVDAAALAVDGTHAYWLQWSTTAAVFRAPIDASAAPTSLASSFWMPVSIAVNATNAFFTANTGVRRIPKTGGSASNVGAATADAGRLAIDASRVYWVTDATPGAVYAADFAGSINSTLLTNQARPTDIAVDASNVYIVTLDGGTLVRVGKTGLSPTVLASGLNTPSAVATDGVSVFYSEANAKKLWQIPVGGGTPVLRYTGSSSSSYPYRIALDATTVFFIDFGTKQILAMTK